MLSPSTELATQPDGRVLRRRPPSPLPSNAVTVLHVDGSLFYAGARTLERLLPSPGEAVRPVVVLCHQGGTAIGATLVDVLARYADDLHAAGGWLYLSGVSEPVRDQLIRSGKIKVADRVQIYLATAIVGEATRQAVADATTWLAQQAATAGDVPLTPQRS